MSRWVLCRGDPILDDRLELLGRHAGVSGHQEFDDRVLAPRQRGFEVTFEQRGEGLFVLPLRVFGRERPDPVDGEEDLKVERLLGPERAVIVESGNPFGRRYEVG
jgi:hypothetical protein